MRILINTNDRVVAREITQESTISELEMFVAAQGFELGSFALTSQGVELSSLAGLQEGSQIDLALLVDGGKKKKKKKIYKTPKKNKHVHTNTKLKILTYYNVGNDGTVERTKMVSPYSPVGKVCYMAKHANRHYCGRSHIALMTENNTGAGQGGAKKGGNAPAQKKGGKK